jgi:hypothetical protein
MIRALKFSGLLVVNLVVAIIGTAIMDTAVGKVIPVPPHSIPAIIWREYILSIICAALIGFGMWRTWRNSVAKWIWIAAAAWFLFGLLAVGRGDVWGQLSGFGSKGVLIAPDVRAFFAFTVPLVRALSYSVGAYVSSLFYPASVVPV